MWYTLMIGGHIVDGSTEDEGEATESLRIADLWSEGEAWLKVTEGPIAW